MNAKNILLAGSLIASSALLGGCDLLSTMQPTSTPTAMAPSTPAPEAMMEKTSPSPTVAADSMAQEDPMMKKDDTAMMQKPGVFLPYDTAKFAMAKTGKVVLFFDASWCPHCKSLKKDLQENPDKIPSGLTLLDVDYDSTLGKELKNKYGVTMQHTFVVVDENGNKTNIFSGGDTIAEFAAKL